MKFLSAYHFKNLVIEQFSTAVQTDYESYRNVFRSIIQQRIRMDSLKCSAICSLFNSHRRAQVYIYKKYQM